MSSNPIIPELLLILALIFAQIDALPEILVKGSMLFYSDTGKQFYVKGLHPRVVYGHFQLINPFMLFL